VLLVFVETAKTECCLSSAALWHDGQTGVRAPVTMVSNRLVQSRQMYSKIGMALCQL